MLGVRILISGGILKLFGGAIIAVMLLLILRRESPDIALTAKMCAGVVLSLVCVASMSPIVEYIAEIGEGFGVGESLSRAVEVLLKALGISYWRTLPPTSAAMRAREALPITLSLARRSRY